MAGMFYTIYKKHEQVVCQYSSIFSPNDKNVQLENKRSYTDKLLFVQTVLFV